jgi:hypothetical protein
MTSPLLRGGLPVRSNILVSVKSGNENKALRQGLPKIAGDAHAGPGKCILVPKPIGVSPSKKNLSRILPPLVSNDQTDDKFPPIDVPTENHDLVETSEMAVKETYNQQWRQFEQAAESPPGQRDSIGLPSLGNRMPTAKRPTAVQNQLAPLR